MESWVKTLSHGLLSGALILLPQAALGQPEPLPDLPLEFPSDTTSPETPPEVTPESLSEPLPDSRPEFPAQTWQWSTLPEGTHLISSANDPDAESEMFAFFDRQADRIWGVRFINHPGTLPTCFQGQIVAEHQATEVLSAVEVNPEEWHFNDAPLDFSHLSYLLTALPTDWSSEQVAEQIDKCRAQLISIQSNFQIEPDRNLLLGVQSSLTPDRAQTLQDGSFFNEHGFSGQAGQAVQILMTSAAFDTYLILLDASGATVKTDDDSGGDQNAEITVNLPASGHYRVIANTYDFLGEGEYTLTVTTD